MSRYAAFISYSHADSGTARWLHRAIETYRLPKALQGTDSPFGPVPRRLPPVFRDRDELAASGDLGQELRAALAASRFQIVLCSPNAARSHWVDQEIIAFKRVHGEARTLAVILSGEPYAGGEEECFPPALRFRLGADGELSDVPAEPIAADLRPGKDGRRLALLKLVAGIAGVPLDALARRDQARRQQRLVWVAAASLGIAVLTGGLAVYAEIQRRFAVSQQRLAERSLDFLVGTFAIANPATENPRTITALTILDRASRRATGELADDPAIAARLLRTTGDIYLNLGLDKEAERDLLAALAREPERSEGRARAMLALARIRTKRLDARGAAQAIDGAVRAIDPGASYAGDLAARVMDERGRLAYAAGDYALSVDRLTQATALYAALKGDHLEEIGRAWMNIGQALDQIGRDADAAAAFGKALSAYTNEYGPNHVLTADTIRSQAMADFKAGRFKQAEARVASAMAVYNRVLDADHPSKAMALLMLGRIRTGEEDTDGAVAALDQARAMFARLYGPTNATVGDVDFYVAEALGAAGRTDEALARTQSTKAIYDAAYGPDDPDQAELLLLRARILARGGRIDGARRDCAAGLALQTRLETEAAVLAGTRKTCAELGQLRS